MPFSSIHETLKFKLKTNSALQKQLESAEVLDAASCVFSELFEKDLAAHARPQYLKNRTLTVTCSSSALAQEIRLRQAEIVAKINEKMGKNEVDRIRYLV
jgi:predicted nucleic acid-binding Zn ribbon protein